MKTYSEFVKETMSEFSEEYQAKLKRKDRLKKLVEFLVRRKTKEKMLVLMVIDNHLSIFLSRNYYSTFVYKF